MVNSYIENNRQNIINDIINCVKFESVSNKTEIEGAPFGEECKKVLEYVLNIGSKMGFRTKNIDGYCGYIEFGEGEELVGIVGHLDVVPAHIEDGWNLNPFKAEIINNKIFGRGTIDDKGPVISCLYAMKAVYDNLKVSKRVRLILGLNEEKDWECINYYKRNEEIPSIGFSPDANFPCIYAEKGIISVKVEHDFYINDAEIIEVSSCGNAINVVPKSCYIRLKLNNENYKEKYKNADGIFVEELGNNVIKINAVGKAAHASHPKLGENAITKLFMYLNNIEKSEYINKLIDEGFFELESPGYLGGVFLTDESGVLTSNIGRVNFENGKLSFYTNLRVPVNTNFDTITLKCEELKSKIQGLSYGLEHAQNSLYVDKDSYLVKTLTNIFNEETNSNEEPLAIGGGTYARAFKNFVSFGMTMPGEEDLCHQANENIDIDTLMLSTKIYARAIAELAK